VTIPEVNACDRSGFVAAIGWVFEHSPWVAERAWSRRPFDDVDQLHGTMSDEVASATRDEQLSLLRAHPDLGVRARMSEASTSEQAGAGLDRLTPDQFERLHRLHSAYRGKFAFPFVLAVTGRTTPEILDALEQRLAGAPDEELTEALRQVSRIARIRLENIFRT